MRERRRVSEGGKESKRQAESQREREGGRK